MAHIKQSEERPYKSGEDSVCRAAIGHSTLSVQRRKMTMNDQDRAWEQLGKTYANEGLVLVLGAGVSKGSGIPLWQCLLEDIAKTYDPANGEQLVRELRSDGYSLP